MKKIVHVFGIIGVLATVFSSYIGYLTYSQDSTNVTGSFIHVIHWKFVQALSPQGYEVKSDSLDVIPNNYEFTLSKGGSVLLTTEKRIPFSLSYIGDSQSNVWLDGAKKYMDVGEKEDIPNTNCYVWLHRIENKKSSFQLRCPNA